MSVEESSFLDLLRKLLKGNITSREEETLKSLAEHDNDRKALLNYLSDQIQSSKDILEAEIVYEKTKPNDLNAPTIKLSSIQRWHLRIPAFARVGIASGIVFAIVMFTWLRMERTDTRKESHAQTLVTEKGERKFFKLDDGTEVWLNNESRLHIAEGYGYTHRKLVLDGEAYFAVSKNKKLPLSVDAQGTEVEVLGTVFNLRAYPDEQSVITSLIEGKVKLKIKGETGSKEYFLNPGDRVEVTNNAFESEHRISEHTANDLKETIAYKKIDVKDQKALEALWVDNKLVFNADPLYEMVKKLERWYDRTIIIQDQSLNNELFSGVFEEETCEQVLDLLYETGVNLTYTVQNDTLFIKKR